MKVQCNAAVLLALYPSSSHADSASLRRLGKPAPPPPSPPTTSSPTAPVVWGKCQLGGQSCTKDSDCGICAGGTNAGASCTSNANCKRSTCTITTGSCSFTSTTNAPTKAPITSAPVTSAPVTSAPITQAPVTPAPVTSAPITPKPTSSPTRKPTTPAPNTAGPTKMPTPTGTISFGTLSNWDTYCVVPDDSALGGYETCHGFEIELEGLSCSNVFYTFSYNRYGAPTTTDTATGGCIVKYQSAYDDVNDKWLVTTPVPSSLLAGGNVTPTAGHSCFSSGQPDYETSGCEHFGVSLGGGNPTSTKYRWLIANPSAPGTLTPSMTRVGIPAVTWNVYAGAGAAGGNVVAAVIQAEPPEEEGPNCNCWKWGVPHFVKVYTTQIEYECDLDHLLTDSEEVPQSKSETEIEWILMQARPTCNEDCVEVAVNPSENELELSDEPGGEVKSIIRRYEFYEYIGKVDSENKEAQPGSSNGVSCEGHPETVGCNVLGNYLGAQMAAAVLGLGELLAIATQSPVIAGTKGDAYILMLTAVGGSPSYTWSLMPGSPMFAGLELFSDGFISGTPTESGTKTLEVKVVDADGTTSSKLLVLTITDAV